MHSMFQAAANYGCCSFHDWATFGVRDFWNYHPTADAMGGLALALLVTVPIFAPWIRRSRVWSVVPIVVMAAFWQYWNLKETPGYRWDYAAFDVAATTLAAIVWRWMIEGVRAWIR